MKMCECHLDKLRQRIADYGMEEMIKPIIEERRPLNQDEIVEKDDEGNIIAVDPLMFTQRVIAQNALNHGGEYMIHLKPDGTHYCPVCEAIDVGGYSEDEWIDSPVKALYTVLIERNIIKKAS